MKKTLFLMIIAAAVFAGCKKDDDKSADAPPLAASDQTWTFGDQTWSDRIQCPECNKETFEYSFTEPQCGSYTDAESGKPYYGYNWPYVIANKATMCPYPWRVPTKLDFEALINLSRGAFIDAWGFTEGWYEAGGVGALEPPEENLWSATHGGTGYFGHSSAWYFNYDYGGNFSVSYEKGWLDSPCQVRCVK
jgi:hypothetical protein